MSVISCDYCSSTFVAELTIKSLGGQILAKASLESDIELVGDLLLYYSGQPILLMPSTLCYVCVNLYSYYAAVTDAECEPVLIIRL